MGSERARERLAGTPPFEHAFLILATPTRAEAVVAEMKAAGVKPSKITYGILLTAAARAKVRSVCMYVSFG